MFLESLFHCFIEVSGKSTILRDEIYDTANSFFFLYFGGFYLGQLLSTQQQLIPNRISKFQSEC